MLLVINRNPSRQNNSNPFLNSIRQTRWPLCTTQTHLHNYSKPEQWSTWTLKRGLPPNTPSLLLFRLFTGLFTTPEIRAGGGRGARETLGKQMRRIREREVGNKELFVKEGHQRDLFTSRLMRGAPLIGGRRRGRNRSGEQHVSRCCGEFKAGQFREHKSLRSWNKEGLSLIFIPKMN